VTPCTVAVGYQSFGGPCCVHRQGEANGAGKEDTNIGFEYKGEGGRVRQPIGNGKGWSGRRYKAGKDNEGEGSCIRPAATGLLQHFLGVAAPCS
jgi:hypothetical protein